MRRLVRSLTCTAVMLVVVWNEHETPSDLRCSNEVDNCTGSDLGITIYRLRYFVEASIECSRIEAGSYPFPVFDKEVFRSPPALGMVRSGTPSSKACSTTTSVCRSACDCHYYVNASDHGQTPPERSSSRDHPHGDAVRFGHPNGILVARPDQALEPMLRSNPSNQFRA